MTRTLAVAALVIALAAPDAGAQTAYFIDSDGTNHLWSLDLTTGVATDIGAVNYAQIEGLATAPNGVIYGVDDDSYTLVTINTVTAVATAVGAGDGNLGLSGVGDFGLTFDGAGNLWLSAEAPGAFYSVNPSTGAATLVNGAQDPDLTGLAACGTTIYGLDDGGTPSLAVVDPATGVATLVGPLGSVAVPDDGGLAMGTDGVLFGIADNNGQGPSQLFTVNPATGQATLVANVTDGVDPISGIEGLTTASPPPVACQQTEAVPALGTSGTAGLILALALVGAWLARSRAS
jgi:hypothetical protein